MSMNVQCLMEGGWRLVQSVENIGDGEERGEKEPLVPREKMTGWSTAHQIFGLWADM